MITYVWRGDFGNAELDRLHGEAFGHEPDDEWNWWAQVNAHSLGWVTARSGDDLAGFVNVLWDGAVHAWLQDVMVADRFRRRGVGTSMVELVRSRAARAGCEWLHVDFDDDLQDFYIARCGFTPTPAGIMRLERPQG